MPVIKDVLTICARGLHMDEIDFLIIEILIVSCPELFLFCKSLTIFTISYSLTRVKKKEFVLGLDSYSVKVGGGWMG